MSENVFKRDDYTCKNCGHDLMIDINGKLVFLECPNKSKNNPKGLPHYYHSVGVAGSWYKCRKKVKGKICGCIKPEPKGV